jgi:hypothetical protein
MTDTAGVWAGPCLLAPMACDVLLIGQNDEQSASLWASTFTNYYNLYMGADPGPTPFQTADQVLPIGAHLMWTLPSALRHGVQDPNTGVVTFPNAPNRWLVVRIMYPTGGGAPVLSAGVVNSDVLTPRAAANQNDPQYPSADGGEPNAIGQYQALPGWTAPVAPSPYFLTAVGPGTVSWAAAYDNVRNVFGLYDPLQTAAASYSYMLAGWYADPSAAPAHGMPTDTDDDWLDALHGFGWSLGNDPNALSDAEAAAAAFAQAWGIASGTPSGVLPPQTQQAANAWLAWRTANGSTETPPTLPIQIVCHSLVATIDWKGSKTAYGTGAPGGGTSYPTIAIGNTGAEAISSYMAQQVVTKYQKPAEDIPVIERAMEAFQLGLLNQLDRDIVGTESKLQGARFGSARGGTEWIVVQSQSKSSSNGQSGSNDQASPNTTMIALTPAQTQMLTQLNTTQQQLDTLSEMLETQRAELGALIEKTNSLGRTTPAWLQTQVQSALAALSAEVELNLTQATALPDTIAQMATALSADLGDTYEVKSVTRTAFYHPNDPVLLVAGAALDTKLAAPGKYSDDDTLRVRFTGQTVTGFEIDFEVSGTSTSETLTAEDLLAGGQIVLPANGPNASDLLAGLPKEIVDLLIESVLLDPGAAAFLAGRWFAKAGVTPTAQQSASLAAQIAAEQEALWSGGPEITDSEVAQAATGFIGVAPAATGVCLRSGQPWTPIYVDWQVRLLPAAASTDPLASQLADWQLEEYDYAFTGTLDPTLAPQDLAGRSVVGAEGAQALQAQFATFEDDPDYADLPLYIRQDLERVAALIGSVDMLTQSLTGFSKALSTRLQTMMQLVELNGVTQEQIAAVGDGPWTFQPNVGSVESGPPTPGETDPNLPFFPVRAGHIQLIKVWVVDSFGQILVGQDPRREPAPIQMIVNTSMQTQGAGNEAVAQLPPRIVQDSRAEVRLISASDDSQIANSSLATTPICGFVMVNYLDQSLMVFDAAGQNQGSILTIARDTAGGGPGSGLRWEEVPGSSAPLGAGPSLGNAHLQGFVTTLISRGMTGDTSFGDLLDIIDATVYRLGAAGSTDNNGNLSVLMGQPIAVVRARLEFDLRGDPDYYQWWSATGQYYVDDSGGSPAYKALPTPINSLPLGFRIGDLGYQENGVVGYFVDDAYSTIYSAHAYTPTSGVTSLLRSSPGAQIGADSIQASATPKSGYVSTDHLIEMAPGAAPTYVTILMAPSFQIPMIAGAQPAQLLALPPGATGPALNAMTATFRIGPVLLDPSTVRMPLPSQVRGKWGWAARTDVTTWTSSDTVVRQDDSITLSDLPPTLSEGWLTLSGAVRSGA